VTVIDQQGVDFGDWVEAAKEAARRALEIEARDSLLDVFPREGMILVDDELRTILEVPFGMQPDEPEQLSPIG
jgi:hypothetical protein